LHGIVPLKQLSRDVWFALPIGRLIYRAGNSKPRLVPIAACERAALEAIGGSTNLDIVVVAFPILVAPIENESAGAHLTWSGLEIALNGIPLRSEKCRDRLSRKIGLTCSHLALGHIVEI